MIKVHKDTVIAVVGDIHEQSDHYFRLIERYKPSSTRLFVSVGDVYDKGAGPAHAEKITQSLQELNQNGFAYVVRGNHEIKNIKRHKPKLTPELQWWNEQPLYRSFLFPNGSKLTVLHGGVKPAMKTFDDLEIDLEVCYIRDLDQEGKKISLIKQDGQMVPSKPDGKAWHTTYDGRFGYIASGHDCQRTGVPLFYNFSCNLDTGCYETGILTCQVFSQNGREELIQIK